MISLLALVVVVGIFHMTLTKINSLELRNEIIKVKSEHKCNRNDKVDNNNVVYGHIHMAKTAGSTINGRLSLDFERVCGNKGYSFDSYRRKGLGHSWDEFKKWGWEDCDYLSWETGWGGELTWEFWKRLGTEMDLGSY